MKLREARSRPSSGEYARHIIVPVPSIDVEDDLGRADDGGVAVVRETLAVHPRGRRVVVGRQEIDEVVSKWTGVPLTSITEDEGDKLLRMEEELHGRVISQEKAISALSRAIRRSRAA